jgi:type IV secretion system protein VirB6
MAVKENHVFDDILSYVETATTKYFTEGAASVAGSFQSTAHVLVTIYVLLYGWMLLRGLVQEPLMDGVARIIKASFIFTFATNSSLYAHDVATFLYDWPPALVGALSGSEITNTTQLLDQIADTGLDLASKAWQTAKLTNLGGYLLAFILFVVTLVVAAITAVLIISSKFGLALLLALGPIFILMALFDATRKFFDMWLSTCITAGFTIVLVSMAASLMFKYYAASFEAASEHVTKNGGIVSLGDIVIPTVVGIIAVFFIYGIPQLAGSLGGGISTASAAAASWAYDKLRGATPSPKRVGKAGYEAGKALYNKARNVPGSFNRGQGKSNSVQSNPKSVYRRITSSRSARAKRAA